MSWPQVAIKDVADIVSGATPKSKVAEYWGEDVRWATPTDLSKNEGAYLTDTARRITYAGLSSCAAQVLPPRSVLMSSRAPIGLVAINTEPMATNQGFKSLVPDRSRVFEGYLYHWLAANTAYLQSLGNGATFKEVSKAVVQRIEIPLPPLEEQRRIAGILDAADALRRRRREALALLDTLPSAIFAEMFGDPRDNPTGYPARKLSDLCSRITVGVVIKPASYYVDDGVPALRSVNLREGTFDLKDLKYFSEQTNDGPLKKSKIREGDVVIVRTGQPGRAAVVTEEIAGSNCIDMLIASPKEHELLPYFLEAFLNSDAGRQMALSNQTGQVQQHLNAAALKSIDFITPPIDEQREFTRRLDEIRRVKGELTTHLCELEALFTSLQSRAFAGEL